MRPLPPGQWGETCWGTRTVTIDCRLGQAQRRSALTHELVHAMRGPAPDEPVLAAREESAVEDAAARLLIDIHDLGEALAWAHDVDEAADELWVDCETLLIRLEHLHPAERAYLTRRLGDG